MIMLYEYLHVETRTEIHPSPFYNRRVANTTKARDRQAAVTEAC
ncbi:hypothetical protein CI610_02715 [invertebrate metagenome]|uniref:Uncharacterized protein n=1 Tax=invertebrate metagenome TaxID=1711999 RepID=A0A2H9T558_9ZZZZ